jgi:hypothetical protein
MKTRIITISLSKNEVASKGLPNLEKLQRMGFIVQTGQLGQYARRSYSKVEWEERSRWDWMAVIDCPTKVDGWEWEHNAKGNVFDPRNF